MKKNKIWMFFVSVVSVLIIAATLFTTIKLNEKEDPTTYINTYIVNVSLSDKTGKAKISEYMSFRQSENLKEVRIVLNYKKDNTLSNAEDVSKLSNVTFKCLDGNNGDFLSSDEKYNTSKYFYATTLNSEHNKDYAGNVLQNVPNETEVFYLRAKTGFYTQFTINLSYEIEQAVTVYEDNTDFNYTFYGSSYPYKNIQTVMTIPTATTGESVEDIYYFTSKSLKKDVTKSLTTIRTNVTNDTYQYEPILMRVSYLSKRMFTKGHYDTLPTNYIEEEKKESILKSGNSLKISNWIVFYEIFLGVLFLVMTLFILASTHHKVEVSESIHYKEVAPAIGNAILAKGKSYEKSMLAYLVYNLNFLRVRNKKDDFSITINSRTYQDEFDIALTSLFKNVEYDLEQVLYVLHKNKRKVMHLAHQKMEEKRNYNLKLSCHWYDVMGIVLNILAAIACFILVMKTNYSLCIGGVFFAFACWILVKCFYQSIDTSFEQQVVESYESLQTIIDTTTNLEELENLITYAINAKNTDKLYQKLKENEQLIRASKTNNNFTLIQKIMK